VGGVHLLFFVSEFFLSPKSAREEREGELRDRQRGEKNTRKKKKIEIFWEKQQTHSEMERVWPKRNTHASF